MRDLNFSCPCGLQKPYDPRIFHNSHSTSSTVSTMQNGAHSFLHVDDIQQLLAEPTDVFDQPTMHNLVPHPRVHNQPTQLTASRYPGVAKTQMKPLPSTASLTYQSKHRAAHNVRNFPTITSPPPANPRRTRGTRLCNSVRLFNFLATSFHIDILHLHYTTALQNIQHCKICFSNFPFFILCTNVHLHEGFC